MTELVGCEEMDFSAGAEGPTSMDAIPHVPSSACARVDETLKHTDETTTENINDPEMFPRETGSPTETHVSPTIALDAVPHSVEDVSQSSEVSQVFEIMLEDEVSGKSQSGHGSPTEGCVALENSTEGCGGQIFYLPLAVGASAMSGREGIPKELSSLATMAPTFLSSSSSTTPPGSEKGSTNAGDPDQKNQGVSDSRQTDSAHPQEAADSVKCAPPILVTNSLLKSSQLPESITQQFNTIARLNKRSISSRRTVNTSTTKLTPVLKASVNCVSESFSSQHVAATVATELCSPGSDHSPSLTSLEQQLTSEFGSKPFHAKFHSDGSELVTDLSPFTMKSAIDSPPSLLYESRLIERPRHTGCLASGSAQNSPTHAPSVSSITRPVVYGRSTTAECLPVGGLRQKVSSVVRSNSAFSGVRQDPTIQVPQQSPVEDFNVSTMARSLPGSSGQSQGQSSIDNVSNEGSTSSLHCSPCDQSILAILPIPETVKKMSVKESESPTERHLHPHQRHSHREKAAKADDSHDPLSNRRHIVKELIHVEKEYVGTLASLVNSYIVPIRQEKILDDQQLDMIFFKINELLNHHLCFLNTLQMWETTNTVGDKLMDMFSREAIASCYCAYVEHLPSAEKALETCLYTKSIFQRFCEHRQRTLRNKLPLKALLVQPVQRIPRYELLVKRLLQYTPEDLADHALLKEAEVAIHALAVRVNTVKGDGEDESLLEGTRLLQRLLAPATLSPNRQYIRNDTVSIEERKQPVCIFLFSDQIVFTIAKRRGSQMIKKPLFLRLQSPRGIDTIENIKYKIYHRLGIDAIEFDPRGDVEPATQHRELRDKKDLALLAEIENISAKLDYRHHELDTAVRKMYQSIQQELENLRSARFSSSVEKSTNVSNFSATMKEGIERHELTFPSNDKLKNWEKTIMELKRQLSTKKRTLKLCHAVEIPRIATGVQISYAAVVETGHPVGCTDVWICAGDGYTGYLCLLGLQPTPAINLNVPLAGCTSKITCICAVPGFIGALPRRVSYSGSSSLHRVKVTMNNPRIPETADENENGKKSKGTNYFGSTSIDGEPADPEHVDVANEENVKGVDGPQEKSSDAADNEVLNSTAVGKKGDAEPNEEEKNFTIQHDDVALVTDLTPENREETSVRTEESTTVRENTVDTAMAMADEISLLAKVERTDDDQPTSEGDDTSDVSDIEDGARDESGCEQTTQSSTSQTDVATFSGPSSQSAEVSKSMKTVGRTLDTSRPTMWLGTADGSIFVFPATDNIKTTRQRQKIKVLSSVNSILHLDVRIFVACQNGNLFVYNQNNDGMWNIDAPITVHIKSDREEVVEIRRMLAVAGNIWCAAHRFIYVLNSVTLNVELSFPLNGSQADPRGIDFMAYGNQTVWLATDNSSLVSLYHATTGEFLMETDLKPVVRRSLIHCDEVIKWHKEVCLRITCMTVCKDQLWVGTSAGIIVTITIPRVGLGTTQTSMKPPQVEANMTALSLGHIGNVRFFVTLESPNANPLLEINDHAKNAHNSASSSTKFSPLEKMNIYVSSCIDSPVNGSVKSSSSKVTPSDEPVSSEVPCVSSNSTAITTDGEQESSISPSLASLPNTQPSPGRRVISKTSAFQTLISASPAQSYGHARHHLLGVRRPSINPCTTFGSPMQVISGGDGLERFTSPGSVEGNAGYLASEEAMSAFTADGLSDSKNFLLIWEVQ